MVKKTFRSSVSVLVLLFILIICIINCVLAFGSRGDASVSYPSVVFLTGIMVFIILFPFLIRYVVSDGFLQIKILGFLTRKINLAQVVSVHRSYNLLSSPAGSLKRLKIKVSAPRSCLCLISPANEAEFIQILQEANPAIEVNLTTSKAPFGLLGWDL